MGKIVCVANQKGGVGKTTTCVNLCAALSLLGKKTLLVDFDPQGNAGSGMGLSAEDKEENVYHVIINELPIRSVIRDTAIDKMKIVPSNRELIGAEVELIDAPNRTHRLSDAISTVQDEYDFILIDCPPSLGQLTINALVAAETVLVTIQSEYYALEGLSELMRTIELIQGEWNNELGLEGILVTMFDKRNNLSHQVNRELRNYFPELTYDTIIPRNVRLSEAPSFGQPIFLYDIRSAGAQAYLDLGREFLRRNGLRGSRVKAAG